MEMIGPDSFYSTFNTFFCIFSLIFLIQLLLKGIHLMYGKACYGFLSFVSLCVVTCLTDTVQNRDKTTEHQC